MAKNCFVKFEVSTEACIIWTSLKELSESLHAHIVVPWLHHLIAVGTKPCLSCG